MSDQASDAKKTEVVKSLDEQGKAAIAYAKVKKTYIDIDIPRNMGEVESLARLIETIRVSTIAEDKKTLELDQAEQELKALKEDVLSVALVPLRARDIILIQAFIAEANVEAAKSSLGLEARLFMIIRAEQCATIWLATRRRDDLTKKYFEEQEEVALLNDQTINAISKAYKENFVLTDSERKNSQGAGRS